MAQLTIPQLNNPIVNNQPPKHRLVKKETDFKLTISDALEEKFRVLLNKFPATEWSGILFYSFTGSLEDKSLAFEAKDMFFMDLGSGVYTEFDPNSEDVLDYILNHELFGLEMGLVHSHHGMPTFFSSTDNATLTEEGAFRNHFLSLIVNNAGVYNAYFTEKAQTTSIIKQKIKCKTFGDREIIREEETQEISESVIIAHHCSVEVTHKSCTDYDELMTRIAQCVKNKENSRINNTPQVPAKEPITVTYPAYQPKNDNPELDFNNHEDFENYEEGCKPQKEDESVEYSPYKIDEGNNLGITEEEARDRALQLLSCNYLINTSKAKLSEIAEGLEDYLDSRNIGTDTYYGYAESMFETIIRTELSSCLEEEAYLVALAKIYNIFVRECEYNEFVVYFMDELKSEIEKW